MSVISEVNLSTTGSKSLSAGNDIPTTNDDGGALVVGTELVRDSGTPLYWSGSDWKPVTANQKLCQIADLFAEIRDLLSPEGE